jgi:MHS family proline/betaine transporter-like MFS transporter
LPFHIAAFRLAFGIGVIGGPVALLLRRRLHDAPAFLANRHKPKAAGEPPTLSGVAIVAGMLAIGTAQTYLVIYLPTYAAAQLHMTAGSALGSVFYSMSLPWRSRRCVSSLPAISTARNAASR